VTVLADLARGHSPARVLMHRWLRGTRGLESPVLDLGCGGQTYAPLLDGHRVVGVDLSGSGDIRADLERPLPFCDDTFPTVVLFNVLELVRNDAQLLREIRRVLRPGGRLVLWTPFLIPVHHQPRDYRRHTGLLLEKLLGEADFTRITVTPHGGLGLVVGTFGAHLAAPVPFLPRLTHAAAFGVQRAVDVVRPRNAETWPVSFSAQAWKGASGLQA
jgi:SAM-dependent methyltransferase